MTAESTNVHLLTVPEAARLLRIGRNLAYELVARGELPSVRLGRVIRVPRAALDAWLETESTRPAPRGDASANGRARRPG